MALITTDIRVALIITDIRVALTITDIRVVAPVGGGCVRIFGGGLRIVPL